MYFKQKIGILGENIACKYLERKKFIIKEKNFKCKQGEIDIIAMDNIKKEIVFCEVKTRTNLKYGKPSESINIYKKIHIYNSSKYYLYLNKFDDLYVRFDVIEVYINKNRYIVNHIEQAF